MGETNEPTGATGIDLDAMRESMDPKELAEQQAAHRAEVQKTVNAGEVMVGQDDEQQGAGQGGGVRQQAARQQLATNTQEGVRVQADQMKTPAVRDFLANDDDLEETAEAPAQQQHPGQQQGQRKGMLRFLNRNDQAPAESGSSGGGK